MNGYFVVRFTEPRYGVSYAVGANNSGQRIGLPGYAVRYDRETAETIVADFNAVNADPAARAEIVPATAPRIVRAGLTYRAGAIAYNRGDWAAAERIGQRERRF